MTKNDISLVTANPAVMQPVIKEFPDTIFVLLHSSYPFSQEAGYLATVYHNVYCSYIVVAAFTDGLILNSDSVDFGDVFPMVNRDGQRTIIRQVLELTPRLKYYSQVRPTFLLLMRLPR